MTEEKRQIYWVITRKHSDDSLRPFYFLMNTPEDMSYKLLLIKMRTLLVPQLSVFQNILLTYSRGDELPTVVIQGPEDLRIALDYVGEDAFDPKRGFKVCVWFGIDDIHS